MKFIVEQSLFLKTLGHIQSVVEKRTTIPILANVKIEAKENQISLNATDMDVEIVENISANVTSVGSITVSAHKLYGLVKEAPQGQQIQVEATSPEQLIITFGKAKFTLSCLPVEDFPALGADKLPHQFSMPINELSFLLKKAAFAMSNDETRYYLNGVFFHVAKGDTDNDVIRAVSTDGHRLACIDAPMPSDAKNIDGIIIPKKTVHELVKLLEGSENVVISLSKTRVSFAFGNLILTSKIVDGNFPDYKRVIPSKSDETMELKIESSTLISSIRTVSSVVDDKVRVIKFSINANSLVLSGNDSEASGVYELELATSLPKIDIGFNVAYLQEILSIVSDNVKIELSNGSMPVIIRSEKDVSALYVLMPMRI